MSQCRRAPAGITLLVAALAGACAETPPLDPDLEDATGSIAIASNPISASPAASAVPGRAVRADAAVSVAYVSLPPGSVPNGGLATVRNTRTGATASGAIMAGGLDPVPIEAAAGDILTIEIFLVGGGTEVLTLSVPKRRRPIVVRFDPPPKKRDVPLNSTMLVVFSEPIDPATVVGIRLMAGSGATVGGRVVMSTDGLRVSFEPDELLAANTEYVLSIPETVSDLTGDALDSSVTQAFTTGVNVALASVSTPKAALFVNPFAEQPRTMDFTAQLLDDGRYTGSYHLFYPENGHEAFGTVLCLAIDGNAAWIAGTVDSTNTQPQGSDIRRAWRVVDHGPDGGSGPDQLSLNFPMVEGGIRSPLEWCATKPLVDPYFGDVVAYDLESGEIVVTGEAPSPPPPPPATIERIEVTPAAITIAPGERQGFIAWSIDQEGVRTPIGDTLVRWTSSDTAIATVSRFSVVEGVQPGLITVTAGWGGFEAVASVLVTGASGAPPVLGWFRDAPPLVLTNSTQEYVVSAADSLGWPQAGISVTWTLIADDGVILPELDTTTSDSAYGGMPTSRVVHTVGSSEGMIIVAAALTDAPEIRVVDTTAAVTAIVHVWCDGFSEDSVEVVAGLTVGWVFITRCADVWEYREPHNIVFEDDAPGSPTMAFGAFSRTFTGEPRTIRYRCSLHSTDFDGPAGEVGTVIVR